MLYPQKNLIKPLTDTSMWTVAGAASIIDAYSFKLVALASYQGTPAIVDVEPNTTYTFSFEWESDAYSVTPNIMSYTEALVYVAPVFNNSVTNKKWSITFTTAANVKKIKFLMQNSSNTGTFIFKNFQLELGSVATTFEPYKLGNKPVAQKGLFFDGSSGDYVYFGGIAKIPFGLTDNYSVHARIKTGDIKNQYYGIFSTFEASKGFELNIDGGGLFRLENNLPSGGSMRANLSGLRVMPNTTYDVIAIRKGKDVIFYVNGVLASTSYLDPQTTELTGTGSNMIRIGSRANQMQFLGEIRRVDLFNKVLTAEEALLLSKDIDVKSGLVAKYDFRKPIQKGVAKDLSGNGIDGVIVGTKPGMQTPSSLVPKKNLFNVNGGAIVNKSGTTTGRHYSTYATDNPNRALYYWQTPVKPDKAHFISWTKQGYSVALWELDGAGIVNYDTGWKNSAFGWTMRSDTKSVMFVVRKLPDPSATSANDIKDLGLQIEEGTSVTPFEPYKDINPKPMFQPKKNLISPITSYDLTKAGSTYTVPADFYFLSGFNASATDYVTVIGDYWIETTVTANNRDVVVLIPAKPNTIYRPSCDTNGDVHLMYYDSARAKITQTYNTISANVTGTTPANCAFIGFVLTNRGLGPGKYYFKNWQLEEVGSTSAPATPFEKYKPVNKPAVRYPKKNLFDLDNFIKNATNYNVTLERIDDGLKVTTTGSNTYARASVNMQLKSNTKYSVSALFGLNISSDLVTIRFLGGGVDVYFRSIDAPNKTFTTGTVTGETAIIFYVTFTSAAMGYVNFTKVQLVEGDPSTYEPYKLVNKPL
ncbi:hypothetical protein CPT_Stills42 [Bacillus phage Stills]|uniref:Uncharacterized protein n=1 Tax=Bacillus phage Stills TaxID=1610833 RepID=A0A0E3T7M2_9CAUD|nr:tail protein [Bacillus phage Stills]AKC02670.1 hypothetical protein CPT_Stills42 [Bacillus phage Stills]